MERESLSWRQFLADVNLKDFGGMVRAEVDLIGSSLLGGLRSIARLPAGPLLFVGIVLMAVLRTMLLALVMLTLGTAVLVTTLVRGALRLRRRAGGPGQRS